MGLLFPDWKQGFVTSCRPIGLKLFFYRVVDWLIHNEDKGHFGQGRKGGRLNE